MLLRPGLIKIWLKLRIKLRIKISRRFLKRHAKAAHFNRVAKRCTGAMRLNIAD